MSTVVLDTNVFVAAGFNPASAAHEIVCRVETGELRLAWSDRTRAETQRILEQIPPLDAARFAPLFRGQDRHRGSLRPDRYDFVLDPADRVFLALAEAVGATLITNDSDLLGPRDQARVAVLTPGEYLASLRASDDGKPPRG